MEILNRKLFCDRLKIRIEETKNILDFINSGEIGGKNSTKLKKHFPLTLETLKSLKWESNKLIAEYLGGKSKKFFIEEKYDHSFSLDIRCASFYIEKVTDELKCYLERLIASWYTIASNKLIHPITESVEEFCRSSYRNSTSDNCYKEKNGEFMFSGVYNIPIFCFAFKYDSKLKRVLQCNSVAIAKKDNTKHLFFEYDETLRPFDKDFNDLCKKYNEMKSTNFATDINCIVNNINATGMIGKGYSVREGNILRVMYIENINEPLKILTIDVSGKTTEEILNITSKYYR